MLKRRTIAVALLLMVLVHAGALQADVVDELALMARKAVDARDGGTLPAFPGAEGFGARSVGGRGGRVIKVTNLNASGPGSLQAACQAEGPRIVVFEVSGVIQGDVRITEPHIYIAGQTAPGAGITINGRLITPYKPVPWLHDITVRFLRVRLPEPASNQGDCIQFSHVDRLIFDHVSVAWASDENVGLSHCRNLSVQWCAIEEADLRRSVPEPITDFTDSDNDGLPDVWERNTILSKDGVCDRYDLETVADVLPNADYDDDDYTNSQEYALGTDPTSRPHNFGMILGYSGKSVSIHHDLFAHLRRRAPLSGAEVLDHRNNVIYNMQSAIIFHPIRMNEQRPGERFAANIQSNYFKLGPNDPKDWTSGEYVSASIAASDRVTMWAKGNFFGWAHDGELADYEIVDGVPDLWQAPSTHGFVSDDPPPPPAAPYPAAPVQTTDPEAAYDAVLAHAGCLPRDAVSTRTVQEVRSGTGSWGRHDPEGGLMEGLTPGTPPTDTDDDGMPDDWETARGLDPNDPADRNHIVPAGASPGDRHKDYTYIEYYVNSLGDGFVNQAITEAELNRPPVVRIVTPANGAFVPLGEAVAIRAEASDPDGQVVEVALFDGDTRLAVSATDSCTHTAANLEPGLHTLSAKATDNEGATTIYEPVSVIVTVPGDANLDGQVDIEDFGILREHYGTSDATWLEGDFDNDGEVGIEDFGILRLCYGDSVEMTGTGDATAVAGNSDESAGHTTSPSPDGSGITVSTDPGPGAPRLIDTDPALGEPLSGSNTLDLTFDREVILNAEPVEVRGTRTGSQHGFTLQHDSEADTIRLTWPEALPQDDYEVRIWPDSVLGTDGTGQLDGEVRDARDPASLPSGDGEPGGEALLEFPQG